MNIKCSNSKSLGECCIHALPPCQTLPQYLVASSKVVLTFEFVDEILWCDHSNETSSAVLSHGTIYLVRSSNF